MYMYFNILEICCVHIPSDLVLVAPKGTGWLRTRDFHPFLFLSLFYTSPQVRFMSEFLFISLPLCCSWSFLLFPAGVHLSATLVLLFLGFLPTWSIHLYLYFLSNVLISIFLVISWIFIPVIIAFSSSGDWEIGAEDDWSWQRGNRTSMSESKRLL